MTTNGTLPNDTQKPVTLIIGHALTDVYLLNGLLVHYPQLRVIRYRQHKTKNLGYYFGKLFAKGFRTALGIKMVSVYLRGEIFVEKLTGNTIWNRFGMQKPVLPAGVTVSNCSTIQQLGTLTAEAGGTVIITQSLRLDSAFFNRNKNVLQIIGGRFPEYTGDTALFWAMAAQKQADYCYTIIKRRKYFNASVPLAFCTVTVNLNDTIRSLRIKGIMAAADGLISVLNDTAPLPDPTPLPQSQVYSTPVIFDYLRVTWFYKRIKIPAYAKKQL